MTMTEQKFDVEWTHIHEQHAAMETLASAFLDQKAGDLFVRSSWTQQRIAEKIGKTQPWVGYRLRFGAFCHFITIVINRTLPRNLTEGKFRCYWEKSSSHKKQEPRFREVLLMMEDELVIQSPRGNPTGHIAEKCCDGKWYTVAELAGDIDGADTKTVGSCVSRIITTNAGGLMVSETKKGAGGVQQYRFKKIETSKGRSLRGAQVAKELEPIVRAIERSLAIKISQDAVASAKGELKRLKQRLKDFR